MTDLSSIINQLGEDRQHYFNAVAPPVIQTSNFACRTVEDMRILLMDESKGYLYSRGKNPTIEILSKKLAALDGAEQALLFSSGVAAIAVPVLHFLKQGDHVVSVRNVYSWTKKLFTVILPKFGIECTFVDGSEPKNFFDAVRPETQLIFLESPNTFTFELQDIEAIGRFARERSILTMIDNTYCSPFFMKPHEMGIDLCMQTTSKYIGGHSDIIGGVLTGSSRLLGPLFESTYLNIGAITTPDNAWLMLRSLRTMEIRLNRIYETTNIVVDFLSSHPKVKRVIWPFHPTHPQYKLAKKQMSKCGGLFSMELKSERVEDIEKFCNSLKHFLLAVSWGGHESLVIPVCATLPREYFTLKNSKHGLIRMYIGLEDPKVLIADIEQALQLV